MSGHLLRRRRERRRETGSPPEWPMDGRDPDNGDIQRAIHRDRSRLRGPSARNRRRPFLRLHQPRRHLRDQGRREMGGHPARSVHERRHRGHPVHPQRLDRDMVHGIQADIPGVSLKLPPGLPVVGSLRRIPLRRFESRGGA